MNQATICLYSTSRFDRITLSRRSSRVRFIFHRLVTVTADNYHFKPGQTALVGENLSIRFPYSCHCCLIPACLPRTRCDERLMLNSEHKMKLQGNKHEWVSGKAIWLKESVEGNRQSSKTPVLLFFPSRSCIKGTTSGQDKIFKVFGGRKRL